MDAKAEEKTPADVCTNDDEKNNSNQSSSTVDAVPEERKSADLALSERSLSMICSVSLLLATWLS